ncbi:uncharacterized protein PFLUO_LOCUS8689 [Penicillium psychrofluorescens]|uniref:uncharacterized protein n=1 Tax=Penicillium psychrofluorescens TaxID=3158075 RepID=UPI003CCE1D32
MTQAALIGQTFGLLSGKPRNLLIVQTFHGTVVTWARRHKMFQVHQATDQLQANSLTHTVEDVWKSWTHAEEQIRVAAGLYILDSEISELFMTHPFMQHAESTLPLTASKELWVAPTAAQWKATMNSEQSVARLDIPLTETSDQSPEQPRSGLDLGSSSRFRQYTRLQGIVASIMEKRTSAAAWTAKTRHQFEKQLIQFFDQHLKSKTQSGTDPFCLEVLWHSTFMSLFVDFNRLELVMGRDGYDESVPHRDYVYKWASSNEGHRCALHGALILRKLQSMSLGMEPAVHVPRALYRAATVWYAYSEFGVDEQHTGTSATPSMDFPELVRLNVNSQTLLFEANGYKSTKPKTQESSTLCGLVDLLRRIGHWGLSRKFAEQIVFVLQGHTELDAHGALI